MMLQGIHVELPEMLNCREERALLQQEWLTKYQVPLISFTLNIPGPVKTNAAIQQLFQDGLQALLQTLAEAKLPVLQKKEKHAATGDEVLVAIQGDPQFIKELTTRIEEEHPLGRLFDMDVLDTQGNKLARKLPRRCLLCGCQAQECARSRRHSVEDLTNHIQKLLQAVYY